MKFICILLLFVFGTTSTFSLFAGDIIRVDSRNKQLLPKGKEVDGMIGDWIMKNDKAIAVIAAAYPDREANQMVSSIQGAVIDFTTLKEPFTAETTYILRDGKAYLEVSTEYQNTSSGTISLKLADKLRCDNNLTGMAPAGNGQLAYIYNKWEYCINPNP